MNRVILACMIAGCASADGTLRVAVFEADVTPPIGSALGGGIVPPAVAVDDPLGVRGIVLWPGEQKPLVLCAVDWIGIANDGHREWREAIAGAARTDANRVAVHAVHQHDAPEYDPTAERLLRGVGLGGKLYDAEFMARALQRVASAVEESESSAVELTQISFGMAEVREVASNRRIMGADGKVAATRWTATKDPELRALPAGTIDPMARVLGLWHDDQLVATLSYYATHPQSNYGNGRVSADFVGMARELFRQSLGDAAAIHFNGAGGNIGAGKWNDGSIENRPVLARKLADGFAAAWSAARKIPVPTADVEWKTIGVTLPLRSEVDAAREHSVLHDSSAPEAERIRAAHELAWMDKPDGGHETLLCVLRLGPVQILHMPGELFVEYQLAAQESAKDAFVCMAAYGDYGPGYIGTAKSYPEGGYETAVYTSRTAPEVEAVLLDGINKLLNKQYTNTIN